MKNVQRIVERAVFTVGLCLVADFAEANCSGCTTTPPAAAGPNASSAAVANVEFGNLGKWLFWGSLFSGAGDVNVAQATAPFQRSKGAFRFGPFALSFGTEVDERSFELFLAANGLNNSVGKTRMEHVLTHIMAAKNSRTYAESLVLTAVASGNMKQGDVEYIDVDGKTYASDASVAKAAFLLYVNDNVQRPLSSNQPSQDNAAVVSGQGQQVNVDVGGTEPSVSTSEVASVGRNLSAAKGFRKAKAPKKDTPSKDYKCGDGQQAVCVRKGSNFLERALESGTVTAPAPAPAPAPANEK